MTASLEELGQACVQDYVQSSVAGPKQAMLRRAVDAYERLQQLRPNDADIETRKLFCSGRLQIAQGRFTDAVASLQQALKRDPQFACAHKRAWSGAGSSQSCAGFSRRVETAG